MKRLCLPLLLVCCLLLSACGDAALESRYEDFAQSLREAEALSFTAALRAEYEDKTVDFRLRYEQAGEDAFVTVLEPELVAGIGVRVTGGGTALEYGDLMLDTGPLDEYGLSPMSALPLLVRALGAGHLESVWSEGGLSLCQLILDDHLYAVVSFEPETMTPVRAELVSGGAVKALCELTDWACERDNPTTTEELPNERSAKEDLG